MKKTTAIRAHEAARIIGCSVRQIWAMAKAGEIRATQSRMPSSKSPWLFDRLDVQDLKMDADLATIEAAAREVNMPINTLYSWITRGEVKAAIRHGVTMVDLCDVRSMKQR